MNKDYEINVGGMTPENYDPERDPSGAIGHKLAELIEKNRTYASREKPVKKGKINKKSGLTDEQLISGFRGFQPVD